ncbi:MAG TPA: thioredoxin domain-containing protein [Candidatus Saccharimonadales bacterium]|nr:thioredoxin domain-containing protein [Candidatus Saccharimonadales bacterium]
MPFLLSLPLAAQQPGAAESDLDRRIERQVRAYAEAPPDAKVLLGVRTPSNFPGYDNLPVSIEQGSIRKAVNFLISKDGKKMLYLTEMDLTQDPYARNMSRINLAGQPWRGSEKDAVTVVVYDDFQCPFCARMYVTLFNEVLNRYRGRVKVVIKDFPLVDAHPWAMRAAVDAHCLAGESLPAYWEASDYIHTHQQEVSSRVNANGAKDLRAMDALLTEFGQKHSVNSEKLQACIAKQDTTSVETSISEARSLGVSATPTLFVNGQEFEGVLSPENLRLVLDRALSEAGSSH